MAHGRRPWRRRGGDGCSGCSVAPLRRARAAFVRAAGARAGPTASWHHPLVMHIRTPHGRPRVVPRGRAHLLLRVVGRGRGDGAFTTPRKGTRCRWLSTGRRERPSGQRASARLTFSAPGTPAPTCCAAQRQPQRARATHRRTRARRSQGRGVLALLHVATGCRWWQQGGGLPATQREWAALTQACRLHGASEASVRPMGREGGAVGHVGEQAAPPRLAAR